MYGGSAETGSEDQKSAEARCPSGTFVFNVGASVSGTPTGLYTGPPGVGVLDLNPDGDLPFVHAWAVETTPTNANWDLAVQAICGP